MYCLNQTYFHLEQVKVKFGGGGGFHKHPKYCLPLLSPKIYVMQMTNLFEMQF